MRQVMRPCPDHDYLGCPLERINKVRGQGPIPCRIMLVGEAPGKDEDLKGIPFVGKSGSELDILYLKQCAGIYRQNVYVTNLFKCRTNDKNRDPNESEIRACSVLLEEELRLVNPSFIGLIGRLSTRWMLGPDIKMEKVHGFGYRTNMINRDDTRVLVMPLYHPAFGLHNTVMMRHIMNDFTRFGQMVRGDETVLWSDRHGLLQRHR